MTPSNRKPAQPREAPTEPFKRAVTGALRAIAGKAELDISFSTDRPSLAGDRARLPEPPRRMTAADAAIIRGHADSMALRLSCHDERIHRRNLPEGQSARAVFESVEQARVESIGSRRMEGVASNITAMLDDRYGRANYQSITERSEAPLEDAVALIARERLTGLPPPPSARRLVELWRPWIEEKAGASLDRLGDTVEDQRQFARSVRDLLVNLEMGEEQSADPDQDDEDDSGDESGDAEQQEGQPEEQSAESADAESAEDASEQLEDGMGETEDGPEGESQDESDDSIRAKFAFIGQAKKAHLQRLIKGIRAIVI